MKIGIISDTHDHLPNIQKAVKKFNSLKVGMVIHLGDWCSPFSVGFFKGLNCPLRGVFGNNDADIFWLLKKDHGIDVQFSKRIFTVEIEGKKLIAFHGDDAEITSALIASGSYDVVLTGHNHQKAIETSGKTLHINPGTLSHFKDGKINTDFSIAVYDTGTHSAKLYSL